MARMFIGTKICKELKFIFVVVNVAMQMVLKVMKVMMMMVIAASQNV